MPGSQAADRPFAAGLSGRSGTARLNAWFDAKSEEQRTQRPSNSAGQSDNGSLANAEAAADRRLEWRRQSVEELKAK